MLKLEVIKFEAQDVITASVPEPCGCIIDCFREAKFEHAQGCNCKDPNGPEHVVFVDNP